ncbi:MAG: hypothetical protein V8Q84_12030 [Bilophila sp.]
MRRRRDALQDEVARMATLAESRREQAAGDLSLLEEDLRRLESDRAAHRAGPSRRCANVSAGWPEKKASSKRCLLTPPAPGFPRTG